MAQRVIQHSQHILEVDEKKYKVIVTEDHERLDPDKVYLSRMLGHISTNAEYTVKPTSVCCLSSSVITGHLKFISNRQLQPAYWGYNGIDKPS